MFLKYSSPVLRQISRRFIKIASGNNYFNRRLFLSVIVISIHLKAHGSEALQS